MLTCVKYFLWTTFVMVLFSACGFVKADDVCEPCVCLKKNFMECNRVSRLPKRTDDINTVLITEYERNDLFSQPLYFPAVKTFHVSRSEVPTIHVSAFSNMKELLFLEIFQSGVRSLPSGLFSKNHNMRYVNLSGNKIQSIDRKLFSEVKHVREIHLKNNEIHTISSGTFSGNLELRKLDLSHNKIKRIESNAFNVSKVHLLSRVKNVVLNISHNLLVEVENYTFAACSDVTHLDLSNNYLNVLHPGALEGLHALRHLLLHGNLLTIVIGDLPRIQLLDACTNCLWDLRRGARLIVRDSPPDENCQQLLQRFLSADGLNETDCRNFSSATCDLVCDPAPQAVRKLLSLDYCDLPFNSSLMTYDPSAADSNEEIFSSDYFELVPSATSMNRSIISVLVIVMSIVFHEDIFQ